MLLYFFSTKDVDLIPIVLQGGQVYSELLSLYGRHFVSPLRQ